MKDYSLPVIAIEKRYPPGHMEIIEIDKEIIRLNDRRNMLLNLMPKEEKELYFAHAIKGG